LEKIFHLVDSYLELKAVHSGKFSAKVESALYNDIVFLRGKIILPELSAKYPTLFK
jgi:hypothetical protein